MKVDLHTHTHYSDGTHSAEYVVQRASDNGVSHLAVTDHDCLEGYLAAAETNLPNGPQLISGVEVSTLWEGQEIHVLGLCVNPQHRGLNELLKNQQLKRHTRLTEIDRKLVKAGIIGLDQHIRDLPCCSPGRAHVARFLARNTRLGSNKKAFRTLARKGRFYVRPDWCPMDEAIRQINDADGIAVLAHPHRYPLSKSKVRRLLQEFRAMGGEGLEVCCSNMTKDAIELLVQLSLDCQLWVSSGSDFHSSEATWMDIGRLATLPERAKKNAIWLHPRWHPNNNSRV